MGIKRQSVMYCNWYKLKVGTQKCINRGKILDFKLLK